MADPKQEGAKTEEHDDNGQSADTWDLLLKKLDLDGDKGERLKRLVAMHLLLDGSLTSLLTMRLANLVSIKSQAFIKLESTVARMPIGRRIQLAEQALLISKTCAEKLTAVNKARNGLAHHNPMTAGHEDMGVIVDELDSAEAFEGCMKKGMQALTEMSEIGQKMLHDMEQRKLKEYD